MQLTQRMTSPEFVGREPELADRARATDARVLCGDCVDLGDGEIAYAPLVGALRGVESDALGSAASRVAIW